MIKYFDTHAHYDDKRFSEDREELLTKHLPASNVARVVNIGASMRSSKESVRLAEKYDYVYATVGVHPHSAKDISDEDLSALLEFSKHDKVVAIGEIGLDYHYDFSPRDIQQKRFREQLEIAVETGLPVVIHSREAHEDTYRIVKEYAPKLNNLILHCFGYNAEIALEYAQLGAFIAFGGAITFPKASDTQEAATLLPLSHIILETDCPYIAPVPMRGKRNDSTTLPYVMNKLADLRGITIESAAATMWENSCKAYGLSF